MAVYQKLSEPPVSRYLKFSLKLKTLPFLFFLQHHDIMPYEDKHLVFVIQSERTLWCWHRSNLRPSWTEQPLSLLNCVYDLMTYLCLLFLPRACLHSLSPIFLSLSLSLCVSHSLTRSDSKRSMPIGYMGGTEWCKGGCHGNVQGTVQRWGCISVPKTQAREPERGSKDSRAPLAGQKCTGPGLDPGKTRHSFNRLAVY